jgi:hypothetical protein
MEHKILDFTRNYKRILNTSTKIRFLKQYCQFSPLHQRVYIRWAMMPPVLDLACVILPGKILMQWINQTQYHGTSTSPHALES